MARVVRSEQAELDLEAILDYIDEHSPRAAERLAAAIDRKCALLARFPEMGRAREDLAPGLRSSRVEQYLILYRPTADGIEVVRFVHGARNLPDLFD